jgi:hypothetical protein
VGTDGQTGGIWGDDKVVPLCLNSSNQLVGFVSTL